MSHLSEAEIAGYLSGQLDAAARRDVEAHLESCPSCRAETVAVGRLAAPEPAPPIRRRPWWIPAALAAGIAVLLLFRPDTVAPPELPRVERPGAGPSESMPVLGIIAPAEGATVAAADLTFAWRARPGDSYRITVLTESGEPVWSEEMADTSARLPGRIALVKGRPYFWRVDAIGMGISATTGTHRFLVAP